MALVILMVILMVCLSPFMAMTQQLAPLLAVNSPNVIVDEYIVVLNKNSPHILEKRVNTIKDFLTSSLRSETNTNEELFEVLNKAELGSLAVIGVRASQGSIEHLRAHHDVFLIEANQKVTISSPEDDLKAERDVGSCEEQASGAMVWGLTRVSTRDPPSSYNDATYRHDARGGEGVDAYVIDSGVYIEHADFEGRARWGMTASNFSHEGDEDLYGHGTHVAGTIAGRTYGVAKKANIIAVKSLNADGVGTILSVLEGIIWTCNDHLEKRKQNKKAKAVVNMSLGGTGGIFSIPQEMAVTFCNDNGIPVVIAAGNNASDACLDSPARVSSAIVVGAMNESDMLCSFSNYGPCVDIMAPGWRILSTFIGNPTSTKILQGTSMATPHVAGVIARYLSTQEYQPAAHQVKAVLLDYSTKDKLTMQPLSYATPNRLLYMPCSYVPSEPKTPAEVGVVLGSITLAFVCVLLIIFVIYIFAGAQLHTKLRTKSRRSSRGQKSGTQASTTCNVPATMPPNIFDSETYDELNFQQRHI